MSETQDEPTKGRGGRPSLPPCPACSSERVLCIVYGEPPEIGDAAARGELVIGGCLIEEESPVWHCVACGVDFGRLVDVNPGLFESQRIEHYLRAGSALSAIYGVHAPTVFARPHGANDWPLFAATSLARMHYALETTQALQHRQVDGAVVTRVLYEHAVMFAWVAIDPPVHLPRFLQSVVSEMEKSANDFDYLGEESARIRHAMTKIAAELEVGTEKAMGVADLALHADLYWQPRLEAFAGRRASFRGLYPALFRHFSLFTHPSVAGLSAFATTEFNATIVGRPLPKAGHAVTLAPLLFAMALLVANDRLGWPPARLVYEAFEEEDS